MRNWRLASGVLAVLACVTAAGETAVTDNDKPSTLEAGSTPFDELGKDTEGNPTRISDHRGKVVIVSFWASWCGPCRKELPVLASVAKKVGPDQIKIIAINFHDDRKPFAMVADALKNYQITILRDANGKAARKYEVKGVPRMIIIGRDGKVAADHTGYGEGSIPELVDELNRLLAQQT